MVVKIPDPRPLSALGQGPKTLEFGDHLGNSVLTVEMGGDCD